MAFNSFMFPAAMGRLLLPMGDTPPTWDLRALLLMSDSSVMDDTEGATLSTITTLDEFDGDGYGRKTPGDFAITTVGLAILTFGSVDFETLAAGTRDIEGMLLIHHVDGTADEDLLVAFLAFPNARTADGSQFVAVPKDEGVIRLLNAPAEE